MHQSRQHCLQVRTPIESISELRQIAVPVLLERKAVPPNAVARCVVVEMPGAVVLVGTASNGMDSSPLKGIWVPDWRFQRN